ncbi:uncharacterized protein DUF3277 [Brevibacillus sp. AG162]|uniref:phage structural protein n=1 Tax=Brevibacillus sp. AG162 TaxID=2572910 RepID=UPI001154A809|nr:phage protein [Brevibacillus sp. AG162]TQK41968.1 uncharacterized protein DUF3277 [Brevibacillus sp. AG162]
MSKSTNYSFKKVSLIVAGRHHTGFMDGTPIKAERNEDGIIPHVGADGFVTFAESADESGTITVTYKQNSPALDHVRQLYKAKKPFPISLDDQNDPRVKVGGTEAVVLKLPPLERGTEITGVEVQYYVADYDVK